MIGIASQRPHPGLHCFVGTRAQLVHQIASYPHPARPSIWRVYRAHHERLIAHRGYQFVEESGLADARITGE